MTDPRGAEEREAMDPEWLQKVVDNVVKLEKYQKWTVEKRNIDRDGGNYMGQLYEIYVKDAKHDRKVDIFVKEKIVIKFKYVSMAHLYRTEAFVYDELSVVFANLQNVFAIPAEQQYQFAKSYNNISEDVIVLENLRVKGFEPHYRMDEVTFAYANLAVRQLAKLHSLSFALEHEMPEYFNRRIRTMKPRFCFDDDWRKMVNNIFTAVANTVDDENKKDRFMKFEPVYIEKFPRYFMAVEKWKCCFLHGDYSINNVMVRTIDGRPETVMAVDYQMADYGCPIRDLLTFIVTGTDREFRREHLDALKDSYLETMGDFMKYFHLDISKVYPRVEFETAYCDWLDFGFMIGLFTSVLFLLPETEKLDYQNCSLSEIEFNTGDERFKKRVSGLIDDYIEWGCL